MTLTFNSFKILFSETIMYFQIIEHDVKLIFAYMHKGEISENREYISRKTLGQTVTMLKELDNEDRKPNISASNYNFLMQMTEKRNYWCHSGFIEFIYNENFLSSEEYSKSYDKLAKDHNKLASLYKNVERVRLKMIDKYGR